MKKYSAIIIILILALSVTGCSIKESRTTIASGPAPVQPSETAAAGTATQQTETETPETEQETVSRKYVIAIDAGHQLRGNSDKEPIGPGASEMKNKVASGTQGVVTGIPEYELTLAVSLKLRDILIGCGYDVIMIREKNDVDISNAERAIIANDAHADAFVRIHADGAQNPEASGCTALCQTADNPYNGALYPQSMKLAQNVVDNLAARTGAHNRGVTQTDSMSGINWASVPCAIVEIGFMTNPEEDARMEEDDYQKLMAQGIADGINAYFAE